jgi:hypothetical protein
MRLWGTEVEYARAMGWQVLEERMNLMTYSITDAEKYGYRGVTYA